MQSKEHRFVAYLRVSTTKQGRSGLGLEAQREAVQQFVRSRSGRLLAPEFVEIETGKRNDRPELEKALKRCRLTKATLVVAKLDRLSRNAAFLLTLRDSGVDFIAADLPEANTLSVGVMALVAQYEAEAISARTKAALKAAKARGTVLGGRRDGAANIREYRDKGVQAAVEVANHLAEERRADIEPLVAQGLTLRVIADRLNQSEICSTRGGKWYAQTVKNVARRLGLKRSHENERKL